MVCQLAKRVRSVSLAQNHLPRAVAGSCGAKKYCWRRRKVEDSAFTGPESRYTRGWIEKPLLINRLNTKMGDHWKSLAQKLGAPGMDDPTTSSNESAPESAAFTREPEPSQPVEPLSEVMTPAPEPEVVDEKPRKRSSWEALASMFNIQIERAPAEQPAPEPIKPAPVAPPPPRERESRPAAHREKPRFNEPRRDREPNRDSNREREPEPRLQVFQESPSSDVNPALESMFADAPRGDLDSWKKPPRVVDDIGWGEEVPVSASEDVEEDFAPESFSVETEKPGTESAAETSDRPRRRRRRRGSRRPEGAENLAPRKDHDLDSVESVVPGDDYSEPESFEVDLSESDEPVVQADPERRSSRRRRRGRKRPVDDAVTSQMDDGELNAELASERVGDRPERMPDRAPRSDRSGDRTGGRSDRTSDRSPQSRNRGNESTGDRSAPRSNERVPGERGPSERGSERSAERVSERGADRSDRPARAERGPDGRREKRTERPEPRADRPPRVREERPLPPRSDVEEHDEVDELEEIDSDESGDKHRNIPSWADSLQAIIEGNMENHKRNDNRGGPPRGRPRSRR